MAIIGPKTVKIESTSGLSWTNLNPVNSRRRRAREECLPDVNSVIWRIMLEKSQAASTRADRNYPSLGHTLPAPPAAPPPPSLAPRTLRRGRQERTPTLPSPAIAARLLANSAASSASAACDREPVPLSVVRTASGARGRARSRCEHGVARGPWAKRCLRRPTAKPSDIERRIPTWRRAAKWGECRCARARCWANRHRGGVPRSARHPAPRRCAETNATPVGGVCDRPTTRPPASEVSTTRPAPLWAPTALRDRRRNRVSSASEIMCGTPIAPAPHPPSRKMAVPP